MQANNPLFEIDLKNLQDKTLVRHNEHRFMTPDFAFSNSFIAMGPSMLEINQPYRLKEGRIILSISGEAQISVNLIEYRIIPEVVAIIPPGAIVQFQQFSPDFDLKMMIPSSDFFPVSRKEDLFDNYLLNFQQDVILMLNKEERKCVSTYFSLIWDTLQEPVFHKEAIQHLVMALLYEVGYVRKHSQSEKAKHLTRQEELFHRFIALANQYSKSERSVGFYADKLFLTPRYLNTAIRQVSGQTVMDWVNQSVVLEAQVLLRHSDKLIYEISDELNFPNPSFFCKFFKRMTGVTPQEYGSKKFYQQEQ